MGLMIALLGALPLVARIGIGFAIVAALATGYGVWHHKVYQSGYDAAIAAVADADDGAVNRVKDEVKIRNECRMRGGTWDLVNWKCI